MNKLQKTIYPVISKYDNMIISKNTVNQKALGQD